MTNEEIISMLVVLPPREFAGALWGLVPRADTTIPFIESLIEARIAAVKEQDAMKRVLTPDSRKHWEALVSLGQEEAAPDNIDTLLSDIDSPKQSAKQAALTQFKAAFGNEATLMDACLGLRMACNGAGDPISGEEKDKQMSALEARLRTWDSPYAHRAAFDDAVRQVIVATLIEVGSG